ncbi:uncharacterized protein N7477_001096 [Penicillium maclennaniae]|uniref:uncharacterized protein n=1 Tax=Penicillium maclennaniae TaxID=1343394 RepID=UPI00253FE60D|nr:uncharacterized protein N7477_001096 [Penicillium maclennaniae]KAJ5684751.1 hypothetical protein N7477_001096 [Penicillium maclennaniae]
MLRPLKPLQDCPPMTGDEWFEFAIEEELLLRTDEESHLQNMEAQHQEKNHEMVTPVLADHEEKQEGERWVEWLTRWVYCTEGASLTLTDIRYARVFADKAYRSQCAAENCATFIRNDEELARAIRRKLNGILSVTVSQSPYYDSNIVKALASAGIKSLRANVLIITEPRFPGPESFATIQQIEVPQAMHLGRQDLLNACIRFLSTEEIQGKVKRYSDRHATIQELSSRQAAQLYSDLNIYHPFFEYAIRSVFPLAAALFDTFEPASIGDKVKKVKKPFLREGLVTNVLKRLQSIYPVWKYLTDLHRRLASKDGEFNPTVSFAHALVENNSIELVNEYLLQGGDVNAGGPRWTLLQAAVSMHTYNSRMHKILGLLLDRDAYVTLGRGEHGSALRTAAIYGKWVLLEKLVLQCLSSGAYRIADDLRYIIDVMEDQGGINPGEDFSNMPASERIAMYAKRQVIRIIGDQIRRDEQEIKRHL